MTDPSQKVENLRALEPAICDAYDAMNVVDLLFEDTIGRGELDLEKSLREQHGGFNGYHLCLLTEAQWRALNYAVTQATIKVDEAHRRYIAALEGKPCA